MKKKAKLFLCCLTGLLMLSFAAVPAEVSAEPQAEPQNKVVLHITYDPEYVDKGNDAENRIDAAEKALNDEGYDTLNDAANAFKSLFATKGGTYSGAYKPVGSEHTYTYQDAGAFYYYYSEPTQDIDMRPIKAVEFRVYGTVDIGGNGAVELGKASYDNKCYPISDIRLTGMSNAVITGNSSISAKVAGGYDGSFTYNGEFVISNIEFAAKEKNTSFGVYGNAFGETAKRADRAALTIDGCTFNNQLYMYNNDTSTEDLIYNIKNCSFRGDDSKGYALFVQNDGDAIDHLNVLDNTINGTSKGMNIQTPGAAVVVTGNDISNITDSGRSAIQLTSAESFDISGNNIHDVKGNAFTLHKLLEKGTVINISDNTVKNVGYLFYDESKEKLMLTMDGNDIDSDVNRTEGIKNDKVTPNSQIDITEVCTHVNTEIKNAAEATYEAAGYTGDKICSECMKVLEKGKVIPKLEKQPGANGDGQTEEDKNDTSAQTGDESPIYFMAAMMILAAVAAVGVVFRRKQEK